MIDDNPADVLLTREALTTGKLLTNLHVVDDGLEALAYLRNEGKHAGASRPDLILLDLNLPGMNGQEVLAAIKSDEWLGSIPVVIMTTSRAEADVLQAYHLHANCYITKPVDFDRFTEIVQSIQHFWFKVVTLPPRT
jgi:two-component system response regulator